MTSCQMCSEAPAAVFTPTIAVCKPCHRAAQADEMNDNAIPNFPTCVGCGAPEHGDHACMSQGILTVSA